MQLKDEQSRILTDDMSQTSDSTNLHIEWPMTDEGRVDMARLEEMIGALMVERDNAAADRERLTAYQQESHIKSLENQLQVFAERLANFAEKDRLTDFLKEMTTSNRVGKIDGPTDAKVKYPPDFEGNLDSEILETWIAKSEAYFQLQPRQFDTDEKKILAAANLFSEKAHRWWNQFKLADPPSPVTKSWPLFVDELRKAFGMSNMKTTAKRRLKELRQQTTVSAYAADFQYWTSLTGYKDADVLFDMFRDGLKPYIQFTLNRLLPDSRPKTLPDLLELAQYIEAGEMDTREMKRAMGSTQKRETKPWVPRYTYNSKPASNTESQFAPMDLGASLDSRSERPQLRRNEPRRGSFGRSNAPKLTPAERDRRRQMNLCFECGQSGHRAVSCPKRQRNGKTFVKLGAQMFDSIDEEAEDEDLDYGGPDEKEAAESGNEQH